MRLYDTLTRAKRELPPPPGPVRMYFCGPTVYARAHIGNARPFVLGVWLRSWLRERGYDVKLVHNITDINDKIYAAAPGASAQLAEEATSWYLDDTGDLGLGMPDSMPRATEYVPQIVRFIEQLVEGGFAYAAGGDVYFRVRTLDGYGALSRRDVDQMDQGEGNDPDPTRPELKEDPLDFALWKAHKEGEDTSWDSPWGRGRPGWHVECSAMAEALLGLEFDIHGGGIDLVFPHHENEIAQTVAGRGRPLARLWMHNGMLEASEGEKMAKSVGNIRGLAEVLDDVGGETLVLYFCTGHYRQPLAFTPESLEAAGNAARRIREAGRRLVAGESPDELAVHRDAFFDALADDFNTAKALPALYEWIGAANKLPDGAGDSHLREMLSVLGLESLLSAEEGPPPEAVALAERRGAARAAKDWGEADRLRDQLRELGWEVRDGPQGPELVRAS
jgi:cysteinyl-tRNA synthetase